MLILPSDPNPPPWNDPFAAARAADAELLAQESARLRSEIGRLNKSRSKDRERALAKVVGGRRNFDSGVPVPDVENEWAAFEMKSYKSFPRWFLEPFAQIRRAMVGLSKSPIVVFEHRAPGQPCRRYYAMDEATFLDLHGGGPQIEGEE